MSRTLFLVLSLLLTGCYKYEVDTFPKWCEDHSGADLEVRHRPFWALFFAVSLKPNAVRDDYVRFLNDAYMEKVGRRADRMVWREGTQLHLVNLSPSPAPSSNTTSL